jgi:predicted NBD/HSP70 family sugar kinase
MIFKGHKLTIGLDLGDHWSCYCVLDEAGKIILEQKVATTPEAKVCTHRPSHGRPDAPLAHHKA